jgi:regulator of sigma E protease
MHVLNAVIIILEVLFIFNLIIFVHELGHFLAAKWRGLKIERFAIWFGKPIWKKKIGDVEYALGWIPAGGYVALPQMASMEAIEGKAGDGAEPLPNVSPMDKIIVAFAGPLFSFLLAIAFAVVVWQVGRPLTYTDKAPQLGWVEPEGPAWKGGLRPGDTITEIDGKPVKTFGPPSEESITWRVITSERTNLTVKYLRDGVEHTTEVTPIKRQTKWYERRALPQILVGPVMDTIVHSVDTNGPAHQAGLQAGDKIVAVNGEPIFSPGAIGYAEDGATNGNIVPVTLTVRRGTEQFDKALAAMKPLTPTNSPPLFGLYVWSGDPEVVLTHPGPWEQIKSGAGQIYATLKALVNKNTQIGVQQLGGPVMIIRVYKSFLEDEQGWRKVLWFSVVFNVNLAMLNMLPLPVLDGGHILLSMIELIRRRAANPKLLGYIQNGFAILLISFMIYIAFYDIGDWIRSGMANRKPEPVLFAAPKP